MRVKEIGRTPVAIARRVRGVVPRRVPSIYTEAPDGTLSRIRTPVACGVTVVFTTSCGFFTSDGGAVVSTGAAERVLIRGSGTPHGDIDISTAKTGTGNKRMRTSVPISRHESSFMYSPEEAQETAGIPDYMPFYFSQV